MNNVIDMVTRNPIVQNMEMVQSHVVEVVQSRKDEVVQSRVKVAKRQYEGAYLTWLRTFEDSDMSAKSVDAAASDMERARREWEYFASRFRA